jgi:hypothetical protein
VRAEYTGTSVGNRYLVLAPPHILIIAVWAASRRNDRHAYISHCRTGGSHKPTVRRKQ